MKKIITLSVCAFLFVCLTIPALSGSATGFIEEKAIITKNGTDTYGQVFRKADEPRKLLVLTGDVAFMVDVIDYTIHNVAVNSIDDKSDPVTIDYGMLDEVTDSNLQGTGERGFTFNSKGNLYEVDLLTRTLITD
ncbi:MAG: hypothetical protein JW885_11880 [Deltaproteobacteria bacterium]|nr:hypothetical protein [Candidatus Zymogenaceae bacterium]